jgi:VIT1/CCC1 family predicted Fe2+/Mn2+ transporter
MKKTTPTTIDNYLDTHYIHRSNWLRAAVLGANDGILSISALAIGVAASGAGRDAIVLASLAGLVGGALSMAAGEYVSVSSQTDMEKADIQREEKELQDTPEAEMELLALIYERRGLKPETAKLVAKELTEADALGAHVRDELGINEINQANPLQAALASGAAFTAGGVMPCLIAGLSPLTWVETTLYASTTLFLMLLGVASARLGGSPPVRAALRIMVWGTLAMGISGAVGYFFGVSV